MANWIPFTAGRVLAEPMDEAASYILSAVNLIGDLLTLTGNILKIVSQIVVGLLDPLATALATIQTAIRNFLNDLLNTGFYFWGYAPLQRQTARRFNEWVRDAAASFDKHGVDVNGNDNTPNFSNDAYVGAMVLCVAFPTFDELLAWWRSFLALFTDNWDFKYKVPANKDIKKNLRPGEVPNPKWKSLSLKDIKPVREAIQTWIEALDKFTGFQQMSDIVNQFADFLQRKGREFNEFAELTQTVIGNLIKALEMTGVWVLPIYGRGGNALVKSALLNMEGTPSEVKSSAQEGAEKAIQQIKDSLSEVNSTTFDNKFANPNNVNDWTKGIKKYLTETRQDTEDRLSRLEKEIRLNPQGRLTTMVDKALMSDAQKKAYDERRRAGYPDEASYFNPIPGSTTTAINSGTVPNGVTEISIKTSRQEADTFLSTICNGASLQNPIKYKRSSGATATDFGYRVYKQTKLVVDDILGPATYVVSTGVYVFGPYNGTQADTAKLASALSELKNSLVLGCPTIVDTLDVKFPKIGEIDDIAIVKDFCNKITQVIKTPEFYEVPGDTLLICKESQVPFFNELSKYLDDFANENGFSKPGIITEGNKRVVLQNRTGETANDVGTRSAGEALGNSISNAIGTDDRNWVVGEEITKNVTEITYDENGKLIMKTRRVPVGKRYAPTKYPDFAGNNNWTIGCIVMTGGPSEASAEALFNLLGISTAAGAAAYEEAIVGVTQVAEAGADFNNFVDNVKYSNAKEQNAGRTLVYP